MAGLQTIVELPEFERRAKSIMTEAERLWAIDYIAANPDAGISLGGGIRKLRVPREGGGKSGGFRAVYLFGGTHMPIFLVTVFAKNEKANLSRKQRDVIVSMGKRIIEHYGAKT